jgi:hypothetical protein
MQLMSTVQSSWWLAALAIIAALIVVLFILGFWNVVYTPSAPSLCTGPFTLMEILTLILTIAGAYLLMNYLGRGKVSDLLLILFVVLIVIFTISLYLLSVSSYAGIC